MSEQTNTIMWMAEELDFNLARSAADAALSTMNAFLESAAGSGLRHSVYPASPNHSPTR